MKTTLLLLFSTAILIVSCTKDPDHHVRVANGTTRIISVTLDDTIKLDSIAINGKTDYYAVEPGYHKIGGDFEGNFNVDGDGSIKWTVTCTASGLKLTQD